MSRHPDVDRMWRYHADSTMKQARHCLKVATFFTVLGWVILLVAAYFGIVHHDLASLGMASASAGVVFLMGRDERLAADRLLQIADEADRRASEGGPDGK